MDRYPHEWPDTSHDTSPADDTGGIEFLEDRTRPLAATRGASRFGVSLPGAVAGAFLITAIAFGAAMRPADPATAPGQDGPAAAANDVGDNGAGSGDDGAFGHNDGVVVDAGKNRGGEAGPAIDEPKAEPATKTEPTTAPAPTKAPAPEPTKAPAPEPTLMALKLKLDGSRVLVTWAGCEVADFRAYKVVRSDDEAATWPMGKGDSLVGVVENAATHSFVDAKVGQGRTYTYKVVALTTSGGDAAACRTETGRITTPQPPKPTPDPDTAGFGLSVSIVDGTVLVDWTACGSAGFDYYKVVRSKDATVTFPAGDYDQVIAAVGPDGDTKAWDKDVPGGKTIYYRVFCVEEGEAGYAVLAATGTKSVTMPATAPKPTPAPYTMGFTVGVAGDGVVLAWEACGKDGFSYYKVVRSRNANPSYLPWTDGSEVVAVIENAATTSVVDTPPDGGTWYYRIQSIGHWDGQKVLLGQTPAQSVAL